MFHNPHSIQKHLAPAVQKAWHQVHIHLVYDQHQHVCSAFKEEGLSVARCVPKKHWGFGEFASRSDLAEPQLVRFLSVLPKPKGE